MPTGAGPFASIEDKWRRRWRESGAHLGRITEGRPKFFATYPYSYMNAYAHVGHAFTMLRNDVTVRRERALGKSVLFPFGFHVTGTPIVAAANRVRDGEPKQIKILRDMGIPDEEVPKFADPWHWVAFFPRAWREDVDRLGLHVDWSREFHTTEKNPHYDAFIRWQFRRLREGGYVEKGRHPVIWCPKDRAPVADHDRTEGEGETPQEFTLVKLALQDPPPGLPGEGPVHLVAATLRPETMFGQTNLWVNPAFRYGVASVNGERWIVSKIAAERMKLQFDGLTLLEGDVAGDALVGRTVRAPARDAEIPVLPATFVREDRGTGVVTSVPSDAPFDYAALRDLQRAPDRAAGVDPRILSAVRPIAIIDTPELGDLPGVTLVERGNVASQADTAALDAATDEAYKAGFYSGVLKASCGPFAGRSVADAKEPVKDWLVGRGEAAVYYEPTGPVVCRCLTPAVVKIVTDQWFMRYSDPAWKAKVREAFAAMDVHPELARKQFEHVIGWLKDWACAREGGLGTRLPWDERWIIESLSDSTIYMAYYALAPHLERGTVTGAAGDRPGVDAADLTDAFFNYVLLGEGDERSAAKGSVTNEIVRACRREFSYWYPLDFRNSGKDLLQNHLTFYVFNHVAIWDDPALWPRAVSVNGWVTVDGEKMSKSKGNFVLLRQALDAYGASATRFALSYAGEGVDDANFDRGFAETIAKRLEAWLRAMTDETPVRADRLPIDDWFLSVLQSTVREVGRAMDAIEHRSALKLAFFDLDREWSWYVRRSGGVPNDAVLAEYRDVAHRLLAPFVPSLAAEVRERLKLEGDALDAPWPTPREDALRPDAEAGERFVKNVIEDVREILKVTGIAATRLVLYVAPAWKHRMDALARGLLAEGKLAMPAVMAAASKDPIVKPHAKDAPKLAQDLVKRYQGATGVPPPFDETAALEGARAFLAREFGVDVAVYAADAAALDDPAGKARHAAPGRPAIYVA